MSLFLLVLFPLSFLLAILAFFTGKTMASILTLGSYPSIESICIPAFLALNVVAGFRVFKTAKK